MNRSGTRWSPAATKQMTESGTQPDRSVQSTDGSMASNPDVIRQLIRDENEMVNHRMNWFLLLQGFMFASIAFAWEKGIAISVVFSVVGVLSAISVGVLLRVSILAIRSLARRCRTTDEPVIGRVRAHDSVIVSALLPWHFLPPLFVLAWVALMVIRVNGVG